MGCHLFAWMVSSCVANWKWKVHTECPILSGAGLGYKTCHSSKFITVSVSGYR